MRFAWSCALLAAGCADKVVTLSLQLPANAAGFDATCLSTVEFYADAPDYPANEQDYARGQLTLDHAPATLADVTAAIQGKIDVAIPAGGLGHVELYGWNGMSGFESAQGEMVFGAAAAYVGQDTVVLQVRPNISCKQTSIMVRPVDLIAFMKTKSCAMAAVTTGTINLGTITPVVVDEKAQYFGWVQGATLGATGNATITGSTVVGPDACLAFATQGATTCAYYSTGVCGLSNELEVPIVTDAIVNSSKDTALLQQFPGMVFGAVFTAARAPLAGATVAIDPAVGKVVYVDLDATGTKLVAHDGAATTASGMFIAYTSGVTSLTVTGGGMTKTVKVGAVDVATGQSIYLLSPSTVTVVMR